MSIATTPASTPTATATQRSRGLHIGLWVVQVLLAVAFFMSGLMKAITPYEQMTSSGQAWVAAFPPSVIKFIGISEVAGALGLILPAATRVKPWLTPLAAVGLVVVMVLAAATHLYFGEPQVLPINATLGGLAAFVAWGRWRKAPIAAKR